MKKKQVAQDKALELIRQKIQILVSSEIMTLTSKSYGTVSYEDEDGNKNYKREVFGKKGMTYGIRDWNNAHSLTQGNKSRIRIRKVLKELQSLIKQARAICGDLQEAFDMMDNSYMKKRFDGKKDDEDDDC
jgi:hypothetical protein